jgi:anti-sigma B factor antagonist
MSDSGFTMQVVGGMPVVATPDEIDVTNADELRAVLLDAAAHGTGPLVVDMSRTRFCDSSGMRALVLAHQRAQAEGSDLLLVAPAAPVLRVLALLGIDRIIPNFRSLDEALAQGTAPASTTTAQPQVEETVADHGHFLPVVPSPAGLAALRDEV